jgi:hypothetical protein
VSVTYSPRDDPPSPTLSRDSSKSLLGTENQKPPGGPGQKTTSALRGVKKTFVDAAKGLAAGVRTTGKAAGGALDALAVGGVALAAGAGAQFNPPN